MTKKNLAAKEEQWAQKISDYNIRVIIAYALLLIAFLLAYIAFKVIK